MALTRLRRALTRSTQDSTSSSSSSTSTSQTTLSNTLSASPAPKTDLPSITLTKTTSRLQKIKSWRSRGKPGDESKSKYPGADAKFQELLGGFEMKFGRAGELRGSMDGRSVWSGVSPMGSPCVSLEISRKGDAGEQRVENARREVEA